MPDEHKPYHAMTEAEQQELVSSVYTRARELQQQAHGEFRAWCFIKLGAQADLDPMSVISLTEQAWSDVFEAWWKSPAESTPDQPAS